MDKHSTAKIQDNTCSDRDRSKVCSFDVEFIDAPTKPLIHQAARFLYFFKGAGRIRVDSAVYPVRPDTVVSILPWETSEIVQVDEPLQLCRIVYNYDLITWSMHLGAGSDFTPLTLQAHMEEKPVIQLGEYEAGRFSEILRHLREEAGVESIYGPVKERTMSDLLSRTLLVELTVWYVRSATAPERDWVAASDGADNCRHIFKYLYSHLSQRLTLDKLSAALYMSPSSISKYITGATAQSFNDVLSEMRLAKAFDILTYTDMTLSEAAALCGYSDASHLSHAFTAQSGVTPIDFRDMTRVSGDTISVREKRTGYQIVSYIRQNYSDPTLTIKSVGAHFVHTPKDVNRYLLQLVERNFEDYLNHVRIDRASERLLTTRLPILDVAVEVGYNNIRTFDRNFIKLRGMTPGNFRKTISLQTEG